MPPAVGRLSGDARQHGASRRLCCLPSQRLIKSTTSRQDQGVTAEATISKHRTYRARTKARAIEMLGGRCSVCGYSDERALRFHHVKPVRRGLNGLGKNALTSTGGHRAVVRFGTETPLPVDDEPPARYRVRLFNRLARRLPEGHATQTRRKA
jgi:hypothetical protein